MPEFFLNQVDSTCQTRVNKDENCTGFNPNKDECVSCTDYYYLSEDKLTCIPNPKGVPGCIEF